MLVTVGKAARQAGFAQIEKQAGAFVPVFFLPPAAELWL